VPAEQTVLAWALAIDPNPAAWDAAFAAADRAERVDPKRAEVAPLRTRLNLLALPAKVDPEAELWPRLRGLTGCVLVSRDGSALGALLALHATDQAAAERLATRVIPALASAAGLLKKTEIEPPADPGAIRSLGRVNGRKLTVTVRGATLLLGRATRARGLPRCGQRSGALGRHRSHARLGTASPPARGRLLAGKVSRAGSDRVGGRIRARDRSTDSLVGSSRWPGEP
jgi:hypothetical protein